MSTQRYSVTPQPIETLLTWVKSGEIAIPEIQRPFVWDAVKVRDRLDSLYRGYPVGYLIAWRNPTVKLKDGSSSKGKRILIDGPQRDSRRPSTSYEPISARNWSRGHRGATSPTATLGVNLDPGGVAEGSRGLSAKRDTPGTRNQESPSTPKGSQSRCVHAARVGDGDRKRRVALPPVMSVLRGRYTGSPETAFDFDMRQIEARGLAAYTDAVIETELSSSFWSALLPQEMDTSSAASPYFLAYQAAQVKLGDLGFLSRDITVRDPLLNRSDVHHVYPRNHLKKQGLSRSRYNQIANFVIAQSEINIAIGDKTPETYFADLAEQCNGGRKKYGGITDLNEMRGNFRASCVPESVLDGEVPSYDDFLEIRRKLMAAKMKRWFGSL